ncbi:acyl-CoA dehydrogenase family protein [Pseudomonas sp. H9]|uniref:acyl-CoA dehydrogenase family protein n=1 Tax=Pseudomonas sp. H9 TaxID=483968 RepID=UPI001057DA2C|nr:acyl-CoA dehydrogenase family protein [Pseudomonas sp. H9]TDF80763.1 acyl-CoA dehydrogenase [Pseudomonas sp. H9]
MLENYRSPWLTEDLESFKDMVERFAREYIEPFELKWREQHYADRSAWLKAGELGLILPDFPEEYGGAGGHAGHYICVLQTFAANGGGLGTGLSHIVAKYILDSGTEAQKLHWLPKIGTGEAICAIAMTEPGAGSDLKSVRTRAVKQGNKYVINGAKTFISNGQTCDMVLVVAKTDSGEGAKGVSLFMVDTRTPGFRRGKCLDKIGMHAQDTSEMFFDDVEVPEDCLLGGVEGQGFYTLMNQLAYERAQIGIGAVAVMERALGLTLEYTKDRKAFGKPVIEFQNSRFVLADVKATVLAAKTFADLIAQRWVDGSLDTTLASMGKFWLTERQGEVLDRCLQLFGGYGYMSEYPIGRMWADARVARIYGGSNEIQREVVARSL